MRTTSTVRRRRLTAGRTAKRGRARPGLPASELSTRVIRYPKVERKIGERATWIASSDGRRAQLNANQRWVVTAGRGEDRRLASAPSDPATPCVPAHRRNHPAGVTTVVDDRGAFRPPALCVYGDTEVPGAEHDAAVTGIERHGGCASDDNNSGNGCCHGNWPTCSHSGLSAHSRAVEACFRAVATRSNSQRWPSRRRGFWLLVADSGRTRRSFASPRRRSQAAAESPSRAYPPFSRRRTGPAFAADKSTEQYRFRFRRLLRATEQASAARA